MSNEDPTLYEARDIPQYGADIKEPGEPFGEETLDAIRFLVAEDDVTPGVPSNPPEQAVLVRTTPEAQTSNWDPDQERAKVENDAGDWQQWAEAPPKREWRRLTIVEGGPGRALRRLLTTPRLLSIAFLSFIVYWQPMFIPMLVLVLVSALLLVRALIGQDRMARFVGRRIQRLIWRDPAIAALLEKVTPHRSRHLLYRPTSEADNWEGPIDPSFAQRLSRIRS